MLITISWLVYEHIEIIISLLLKEFVKQFSIKTTFITSFIKFY